MIKISVKSLQRKFYDRRLLWLQVTIARVIAGISYSYR